MQELPACAPRWSSPPQDASSCSQNARSPTPTPTGHRVESRPHLSDEDEISLHLQDTLMPAMACATWRPRGSGRRRPRAHRRADPSGARSSIVTGTKTVLYSRRRTQPQPRPARAWRLYRPRNLRALYAEGQAFTQHYVPRIRIHHRSAACRMVALSESTARGRRPAAQIRAICRAAGHRRPRPRLQQHYQPCGGYGRRRCDGVSAPDAEISDMEFVQFHPTALYLKDAPRFLLSEALRGEGAYLRNMELTRFMPKYHRWLSLLRAMW